VTRGGALGEGGIVALAGDPYQLAVAEAGCLGEDHRFVSVALKVYRVRGQGSIPVQEVSEGIQVFCLSLEDSGTDSTGVLCLRGGCLAGLLALGDDLLSVRVASHGSFRLN
jgi:hypothetical protein